MKSTTSSVHEIWSLIKETNQQIKTLSTKTDKLRISQKATDEQIKRTDKRMDKFIGDTGNRWGKLGENLVKGALVQRLKERGIQVERVFTQARKGDTEFDIVAVNGKEVVVVEVKATLDPSDVYYFAEMIKKFKVLWPDFKEKTVYGAIAYLIKVNRQADSLAEKQGFFVISATGDVIVQNNKNFKPKIFS